MLHDWVDIRFEKPPDDQRVLAVCDDGMFEIALTRSYGDGKIYAMKIGDMGYVEMESIRYWMIINDYRFEIV